MAGLPESKVAGKNLSYLYCFVFLYAFNMKVSGLRPDECKYMSSKKLPLWLSFENADPDGSPILVIFKTGDDLRQDMLTLQLFRTMDRTWRKSGQVRSCRAFVSISAKVFGSVGHATASIHMCGNGRQQCRRRCRHDRSRAGRQYPFPHPDRGVRYSFSIVAQR